MFKLLGNKPIKTWNPIVGCFHGCYNGRCWAAIQSRRQKHRCFYCYHFQPHMHRERLWKLPKSGVVFIVSMGDMWGNWVPREWILTILKVMKPYWEKSDLTFFFESKNPVRYADFAGYIPPNSILSTTIETNRSYPISSAPSPEIRYRAMLHPNIKPFAKHVSIEPNPKMVSIGYDNYNANLPEPSVEEVRDLVDKLRRITIVEVKKDRRGLYKDIM